MDEFYSFMLKEIRSKKLEYEQIKFVVKKINSFYEQVSNKILNDLDIN